jgi:hypothetical protein
MKTYETAVAKTSKGNEVTFIAKEDGFFVKVNGNEYSVINLLNDVIVVDLGSGKETTAQIVENVWLIKAMYFASKKGAVLVSEEIKHELTVADAKKYGSTFFLKNDENKDVEENGNLVYFAYRYN